MAAMSRSAASPTPAPVVVEIRHLEPVLGFQKGRAGVGDAPLSVGNDHWRARLRQMPEVGRRSAPNVL
jgi:hypothetical protein